jgi:Domain of unknown function (DUF3332)
MTVRRSVSRVLVLALLAAPLATTGCFGSFHLTRNVYKFNKDVSDQKLVRWLIFLPLTFVYSGASVLDAVLFNSVEFWTDDNPINLGEARSFEGPNGEVARVTPRGNGVFDVVVTERSGASHGVTLVRGDSGVTAYGASGAVLGRGALVDGRPVYQGPGEV